MKTGRTLQALATEIQRQKEAKRDFVAPTDQLTMWPATDDANGLKLRVGDNVELGINSLVHNQLSDWSEIPIKYYERMRRDEPELLANNINTWFHKHPVPRMVRTLDNNARAFLSDRYRPLENSDLAEAVLPVLIDLQLDIVSCEITEKRLYIKCVDPKIQRDIPKGAKMGDGSHHIFDTLCPAMTISNSEVGFGSLSVETGTLTRACTNLAFFKQRGVRKTHIGARHELGDDLYRMLSDDTRKATDKATWMQIRDVVQNGFNEIAFNELCDTIAETAKEPLGDIIKVVELTSKRHALDSTQQRSILNYLIAGGDPTRYGLANAVTCTAEDQASYEDATALEKLGGHIIEMPKSEWKVLVDA